MAFDCDTFPDRICVSPTPRLTTLQSVVCGCAFEHTCEDTTWNGKLVRVGRCRYAAMAMDGQPCFDERFIYPTLTRSGATSWELRWECYNTFQTPIPIWVGTYTGSGPVGEYERTSGCDVRTSYSIEACENPHTLLVSNLETWADYNGVFDLDTNYSIDDDLIPTLGDSGWNIVRYGDIWIVSNFNITLPCTVEVDCTSSAEVDCAEGLTEDIVQPVQWKQRYVSGSAIGRYQVIPTCEEWSSYRDELVGVSITID